MHLQPCEPERRADLRPDSSFEALFRDHFGFVYQNLRRLGVPHGSVDDAAQEVFLVVLRRPDAPITSVRGWLFGIARRIAWRQRRTAARQNRLAQALADEAPPALDGAGAAAEREAAALLERFLGQLDDDKRAVFLLAELEQMTAPEIARALGVKENTVYSRLRAARQEFDRTFARVRLRERRATGEAALDDRALLLSRARRAHEPAPETRQRAWLALSGPAGATQLGGPAEAWPSPDAASPAQAPAWGGAGHVGEVATTTGGLGTAGVAWTVALGGLAVALVAAALPDDPADRRAPVEHVSRDTRGESPAAPAATPPEVEPVPFARLAAAAARAEQAAAPRKPATNAPKDMSPEPSSESAPPAAAAPDLDALRREAALMADARTALRAGEWTRARELLQRHALEYPAGALVEERQLSLISALCSMGQVSAARAEAARIAGERPGSALARKATAACPENSSTGPAPAGD